MEFQYSANFHLFKAYAIETKKSRTYGVVIDAGFDTIKGLVLLISQFNRVSPISI
jgi:hypothetical protein